jgi:Zn-dependent protease
MINAQLIQALVIQIPPLLLAITVHEVAHGYIAMKKGDYTAQMLGRITLNPLRHIDPVGTVLFPLMLALSGTGFIFGWAKPVPVNSFNFRNPKKDMVYVSLAGPASNLLLALAFAFVLRIMFWFPGEAAIRGSAILAPLAAMIMWGIRISIILGVFNLLPIHPLDGSHMMEGLLPPDMSRSYSRLAPYGFMILIGLMITGLLWRIVGPIEKLIYLSVMAIFGF